MSRPDVDERITAHLAFARAVAARSLDPRCRGADREDLIAWGVFGLVQARSKLAPLSAQGPARLARSACARFDQVSCAGKIVLESSRAQAPEDWLHEPQQAAWLSVEDEGDPRARGGRFEDALRLQGKSPRLVSTRVLARWLVFNDLRFRLEPASKDAIDHAVGGADADGTR